MSARSGPSRARWMLTALAAMLIIAATPRIAAFWREREPADAPAPAGGRRVKAGDVELYIRERGPASAPTVFLLSGMGLWASAWDTFAESLASRGFRVVAVDLPPFGYSERPPDGSYGRAAQAGRVWALADALGLERVAIIGHSFGAIVATEATLTHPKRISALILISPELGLLPAASDIPLFMRALAATRRLASAPRWMRTAVVAAQFSNPLLIRRGIGHAAARRWVAPEGFTETLARPLTRRGTTAAYEQWAFTALYPDSAMPPPAAGLAVLGDRLLLVAGEEDRFAPADQARALAAALPGARLTVLPGVGHLAQMEAPNALAAACAPNLGGRRVTAR